MYTINEPERGMVKTKDFFPSVALQEWGPDAVSGHVTLGRIISDGSGLVACAPGQRNQY
jgi:hypothetical protein